MQVQIDYAEGRAALSFWKAKICFSIHSSPAPTSIHVHVSKICTDPESAGLGRAWRIRVARGHDLAGRNSKVLRLNLFWRIPAADGNER